MAWVKGKSGNPQGRPKGAKALTEILRRLLNEPTPEGETKAELLGKTLITLAVIDQNLDAIRYIYDRLDGKPVEPKEISGPEGEPITASVMIHWPGDEASSE